MLSVKLITLFPILLVDQCYSSARMVHEIKPEDKIESQNYNPNEFHEFMLSKYLEQKNSEADPPAPITNGTSSSEGLFLTSVNIVLEPEVVQANRSRYMVRLFSVCDNSNVTEHDCQGIIVANDTVLTTAACVCGLDTVKVCTRKANETTCPAKYDSNDTENCFETNLIYIHPDFISGLLNGVFCHNIAVLKWTTDVFREDQIHTINFSECPFDSTQENKTATIVDCGNEIDTNLTSFSNQIQRRSFGINAYGIEYLQCPSLYTEKSILQSDVPCAGSAGSAIFVSKINDPTYNPNVDESAVLVGLGSFRGKDCQTPSSFVALHDYEVFLSDPVKYGLTALNTIESLNNLQIADQIKVIQTFMLYDGHIACAFKILVSKLADIVDPIFQKTN